MAEGVGKARPYGPSLGALGAGAPRCSARARAAVRSLGAGPRIVTVPRPSFPSETRTVRGRAPAMGMVISSVRASSWRRIGGRSTNPCEFSVLHRSTGSPPAPRRGNSSCRATRVLPGSPGPNLVSVAAGLHGAPLAGVVLRPVVEHAGAGVVGALLQALPPPVELGQECRRQDAPHRSPDAWRGRLDPWRTFGTEMELQPRLPSGLVDHGQLRRRRMGF